MLPSWWCCCCLFHFIHPLINSIHGRAKRSGGQFQFAEFFNYALKLYGAVLFQSMLLYLGAVFFLLWLRGFPIPLATACYLWISDVTIQRWSPCCWYLSGMVLLSISGASLSLWWIAMYFSFQLLSFGGLREAMELMIKEVKCWICPKYLAYWSEAWCVISCVVIWVLFPHYFGAAWGRINQQRWSATMRVLSVSAPLASFGLVQFP